MNLKSLLFSLSGRIRRRQFWLGSLIALVFGLVGFFVASFFFDPQTGQPGMPAIAILLLLCLASFWMSLALYVKRFHDRDKNAWWLLIGLVPVVGSLWLLIDLGCLSGTPGENRFGSDPKVA